MQRRRGRSGHLIPHALLPSRIESGLHVPSLVTLDRLLAATGFRPKTERVRSTPPSQLLARHRDEILAPARQNRITREPVFGFVARGEDGPDSDLDLLLDFEPEVSLFDPLLVAHGPNAYERDPMLHLAAQA